MYGIEFISLKRKFQSIKCSKKTLTEAAGENMIIN